MTAESPEDILARLQAEADEIDFTKDVEGFSKARTAAEDGDTETQGEGLPNVLPTSFSVLRGMGEEGPHKVHIPIWVNTNPDEPDPDKAWKTKVVKFKIAPYKLNVQVEASEAIAAIHEDTFKVCLAWSYQKGEGDLEPLKIVELLEKAYPKTILNPITGDEMPRAPFTEENVTLMMNATIKELSFDNIEAMVDAVYLALKRFNPDLTREWIEDNCDVGILVRIIGKILYINSGLRDRFLA